MKRRSPSDHGTAMDAINFVLDEPKMSCDETTFLRCWRDGNLSEWPEFYAWLDLHEGEAQP